ncbi:MAG: hypothetical protein PUG55_03490 [Bacillales bacterium]|mgnify:CR=1 FL=1|nr:hypothetical protein [Bacillales bacterium]MDY6003864.1 hypothetical protein [Bacilli bacterium]
MIEFNIVWLISLIVIISFSIIYVLNGIISYKKENKQSYSFLSNFPNELSFPNSIYRKRYLLFTLIYASLFSFVLWDTFPFISTFGSFKILVIFEAIFAIINGISFVLINLIEPKFIRQHTLISTIYLASCFGILAMISIFGILLFTTTGRILPLIIGIITTLLSILQILIILNPKLKDWAKLEAFVDENKNINYRRPKIFILALSEWLTFLLSTIGLILFLIVII